MTHYTPSVHSDASDATLVESSTRCVYTTKHMTIDMGSCTPAAGYTLRRPTYGANDRIAGVIAVSGGATAVKSLTVTFEARLATTDAHPGASGPTCTSVLASQTINLYNATHAPQWQDTYGFEFKIPSGELPPSYAFWDCGMGCDITYDVKVNMVRKRYGIEFNESFTIDILYLPSSSPRSFRRHEQSRSGGECAFTSPSSESSIASGSSIPFTITSSSSSPLPTSVRVTLSRRLVLCRTSGKKDRVREVVIAAGNFPAVSARASTIEFHGILKAGWEGREAGWQVKGIARVEHVLRMSSPGFDCERVIELTTESDPKQSRGPAWGIQEHAFLKDDCGMLTRFGGA